jgi:hypothetical protein
LPTVTVPSGQVFVVVVYLTPTYPVPHGTTESLFTIVYGVQAVPVEPVVVVVVCANAPAAMATVASIRSSFFMLSPFIKKVSEL